MNRKGSVAMMIAACPELTYFSPHVTSPDPPISMRQPLIIQITIIFPAGNFSPLTLHHVHIISPAVKNLMAERINGGKPFKPKKIAR